MFVFRNQDERQLSEPVLGFAQKVSKVMVAMVLTVAIGIFLWVSYSSYKYSTPPKNIDEIRLIRKDITPVRVQPPEIATDKTGVQDRMIYSNFETSAQPESEIKMEVSEKKEHNGGLVESVVVSHTKDIKVKPKATLEKKSSEKNIAKSKPITSVFDVIE